MPNPRKNKPLLAVMAGNQAALEEALANGSPPGLPGPSGMTALHLAVLLCNPDAVGLLLAAKAPLEARDKNGLTPLGYAVLPARETPLPQLKRALASAEKAAELDSMRARIRKQLVAAGADWHAASGRAPTPWERFVHYWPQQSASGPSP